ncbi:hypothetical protein HMI55_005086 [Coelomomyces lativittatus]|nr:hypothetical protein HMI55_005086 [Coelomomyces lativittatus]
MLATHPIHATTSSQHERGGDSMDRPDDGSMTTVPSKTTTTTSTLKVTFFDVKPYQMDSFMEQNEQTFHYDLHFLQEKLSLTTVHLAQGSDVVCVFVHDQLDAPVVHQLHHLGIRLIAFRCAGFDMCDVAVCDQLNVSVVRVPGYSPNAIAEHACAMMLSLNRKLIQANRKVHMGDFSLDGLVGFDMKGKTVGIIGTGKIGACLVQILLGFGCHVICHDVYKNPMLLANPLVQYVSFDDLIQRSDIISLHAPLLKDTFHLIHGDVFKKMKRGVMLINTSRGPLVDTEARERLFL